MDINVINQTLKRYFPFNQWCPEVRHWLTLNPQTTLFVACSGGPDSLCLLYLLRLYYPNNPCVILHYNHRVRAVSDQEAADMQTLAQRLALPIEIGTREPSAQNDEESLRKARYQFFESVLNKYHGNNLFLGQHQDDCFEGLFMRLMRGSRLDGLLTPKPLQTFRNYTRLRPLLRFPKAHFLDACKACSLPYFQDLTNNNCQYLRNRIRNRLIPQLESMIAPNWRQNLQNTWLLLEEQNEAIAWMESKLLDNINLDDPLKFQPSLPKAFQRTLLMRWLNHHHVTELHHKDIENILSLQKGYYNLPCGMRVFQKDSTLFIEPIQNQKSSSFHLPLSMQSILCFPNQHTLTMQKVTLTPTLYQKIRKGEYSDKNYAYLDAGKIKMPCFVRNWDFGDRYRPLFAPFEKKLKNLFVERKITSSIRRSIPVICDQNNNILWVPGLPPADSYRIDTTTEKSILFTYKNF